MTTKQQQTNIKPVIVLTGAAGAIGSATALAFAKFYKNTPFHIVLQDIPQAKEKLQQLVDQINKQCLNTTGVPTAIISTINIMTHPNQLIDLAIEKFGTITTLVHSAGFLRDGMFFKTTPEQFDEILNVHLAAPFKLTQYAWQKKMREQKLGRVVFISSHASFGNVGQSNYSAAKSGLMGLTRTLALEGQRSNILTNAVLPFAASKMTEGVFPPQMLEKFQPEDIAPLIVALAAHENTTINGELLQTGGSWVGKTETATVSATALFDRNAPIAEQVSNINTICQQFGKDVAAAQQYATDNNRPLLYGASTQPIFAHMMSQANELPVVKKSGGGNATNQPKQQSATKQQQQQQPQTASTAGLTAPSAPKPLPAQFIADTVINVLQPHLSPEIVKKANVCIGFEISPGSKTTTKAEEKRLVVIDLKNKSGGITWNQLETPLNVEKPKPDAVLQITDELFVKLFLQEVEAQALYLQQKIKVRGNLSAAMKFEQVLKQFQDVVDLKSLLKPAAKL